MIYLSVRPFMRVFKIAAWMFGGNALISLVEIFDKRDFASLLVATLSCYIFYLFFKVYFVKYDTENIYLESIIKRITYKKEEFIGIKPVLPYINFYFIIFRDGRKYLFGVGSSKIILTVEQNGFAKDLDQEIRQ